MSKNRSLIHEESHEELSKASLALIEKQKSISRYREKKQVHRIETSKGIIETTDPDKWKDYRFIPTFQ